MASTSPQWDNRNRGFIPPSELQQLRRTSVPPPANRDFSSQEQPQPNRPFSTMLQPPAPPAKPSAPAHSRSSSFFAFLKSSHDHQDSHPQQHPAQLSSLQPQRSNTRPPDESSRVAVSTGNQQPLQSPPQQPPPPQKDRRPSMSIAGPGGLPQTSSLHPEIRSVVQLTMAHAHKVYYSGPLVRRIERLPDNHRPAKEGWREVWAQLGGTTLSVWDMKEIEEANKQGTEVPPSYINITDAFVQVLGSVTMPATATSPPQKYTNVVTVNSAGSNLLLFSCPSTTALISWATAFRLSAWEKSRLEEIYTAHLIRITLNDGRETPSPLVRGRMEGWVRLRVAGQTDWKRLWMVVVSSSNEPPGSPHLSDHRPASPNAPRKRRISSLFGTRDESASESNAPANPVILFYLSPKGKDRKKAFLTLQGVTQAFAVYPERPELINRSTLMKIEGTIGEEEVSGSMKGREGWILIMPELEPGQTQQAREMLRWILALHDSFQLYGRPKQYSWDPRDPASLMFAYPLLFLDREMAESMDPREDRTSAVRSRLLEILLERVQRNGKPLNAPRASASGPPTLPPIPSGDSEEQQENGSSSLPQLPPLSFDSAQPQNNVKRILTPISEAENGRNRLPTGPDQPSTTTPKESGENTVFLDRLVNTSPSPLSPTERLSPVRRPSEDSSRNVSISRPDSKLSHSFTAAVPKSKTSTDGSHSQGTDPANIALPMSPEPNLPSTLGRSLSVSPPPLSPAASSPGMPMMIIPPRTPSPAGLSVLTSPHSAVDSPKHGSFMALYEGSERGTRPQASTASTPKSVTSSLPFTPSRLSQPPAAQPNPSDSDDMSNNLYEEAGALYYMQQFDQETQAPLRRVPPAPIDEEEDDDESSSSEYGPTPSAISPQLSVGKAAAPLRTRANSPLASVAGPRSPPVGHRKPPTSYPTVDAGAGIKSPMGRRPSGARAPPSNRRVVSEQNSLQRASSRTSMDEDNSDLAYRQPTAANTGIDDPDADALAALTFLEQEDEPTAQAVPAKQPPPSSELQAASPSPSNSHPTPPTIVEPENQARSSTPGSDAASQYRSSFAPSKNAMQRKAKTEAQQAAQEAAAHRPGRANRKARARSGIAGAWGDSSEEEEEEEEEEDEDIDSDGEAPASSMGRDDRSASSQPPDSRSVYSQARGPSPGGPLTDQSHLRPPRNLPQVPGPRPQVFEGDEPHAPVPRRLVSDQYAEAGRRTAYGEGMPRPPSARPGSEYPSQLQVQPPMPPRHTMWSQIEAPAITMTKAFTPHGLLSVGLQDKEERSAKKQEELARESGASLINVANKPPPPQTGLLGAITAHERERKREGGVGATLTEREREKRLAEERQRKLDDLQRQQLEQMQQGGSMYGAPQFNGYNPMMMGVNPMMTGMNPMMTGFGMGYPGMMGGYANPQHMFAAQQAAQAYQQAMMSFSQAGSQAGGEGGPGGAGLNPMMTGGAMGGFDPRFSMMSMPMMNPMGMAGGMGGGLSPGMGGMSPGMGGASPGMGGMNPGMGPMGMQMTGGSAFDPRYSQFDSSLQPPANDFNGQGRLNASRGSPNGQNLPAGPRPVDAGEELPRMSNNPSPRPPQ
ncbi:hypothetical protein EW146_g7123 [Bondarzewia mesenterica]|uniref:PH domain-containing protein n=1 Tax=Bondarzewia mesenterica TaxID=1095465 RepID=A0A4S4LLM5_9AGAM|nr:hypothetical protein EW146_g7123 [Bondarzewia mesenterica]